MRDLMSLIEESEANIGSISRMMYLTHCFNGIQGGEPLADVVSCEIVSPGNVLEVTLRGKEDGEEFSILFTFKEIVR